MNPLTNMKNVLKLSEQDLKLGSKSSWHDQYKHSAWIFVGGLPFDLTEGDIITIFSQYGEIVNINLIRDKDTGKSKGFCFMCYEDQRSTVLAVDNFNGIKILNRTLRVDHVDDYKMPKNPKKKDKDKNKDQEEPEQLNLKHVEYPKVQPVFMPPRDVRETNNKKHFETRNGFDLMGDQIKSDIKLPMRLPIYTDIDSSCSTISDMTFKTEKVKKEKKAKKDKKHKKKNKKHKKRSHSSDDSDSSSSNEDKKRKKL